MGVARVGGSDGTGLDWTGLDWTVQSVGLCRYERIKVGPGNKTGDMRYGFESGAARLGRHLYLPKVYSVPVARPNISF